MSRRRYTNWVTLGTKIRPRNSYRSYEGGCWEFLVINLNMEALGYDEIFMGGLLTFEFNIAEKDPK